MSNPEDQTFYSRPITAAIAAGLTTVALAGCGAPAAPAPDFSCTIQVNQDRQDDFARLTRITVATTNPAEYPPTHETIDWGDGTPPEPYKTIKNIPHIYPAKARGPYTAIVDVEFTSTRTSLVRTATCRQPIIFPRTVTA